jgi:outer membrane protein
MIISRRRRSANFPAPPEAGGRHWLVRSGVGVGLLSCLIGGAPALAQEPNVIDLSLETAVGMAMDDSYRVRRVRLEIERTRRVLEAERAGLKSRVFMNFALPEFDYISAQRWNSTLQRNEIVRENSRRWQMEFSIEQPVILLGYPTNGYLSANNRVYRYTQIDGDERDLTYYNRYFLRYRQPFFQPNQLKNSIEQAELNLQDSELDYQNDAISIIDDIAEDYYELFELAYEGEILATSVGNLEQALEAASARAAADATTEIDESRVRVALSNAQAALQQSRSEFRLAASEIKPRLGLSPADSIVIRPTIEADPVNVDLAQAIQLGVNLRPQLRLLEIQRRQNEIAIENVRGRNSFRIDLELTYGREMRETQFRDLLDDPSNSYTLGVRGSVPIWDWGAQKARVEAQRLVLERTLLSIEETREQIEIGITNTVQNLTEYQQRVASMEQNLALAEEISTTSLNQYRSGVITVLDLMQSFERQADTAENFLDAYIDYRDAIMSLQRMTYYDFENDVPVLERFGILPGASNTGT